MNDFNVIQLSFIIFKTTFNIEKVVAATVITNLTFKFSGPFLLIINIKFISLLILRIRRIER